MTELQLIKEALAAAKPGPWKWSFVKTNILEAAAEGNAGPYWDGDLYSEGAENLGLKTSTILRLKDPRDVMYSQDLAIIANAPTWLASLVTRVEAAEAICEAVIGADYERRFGESDTYMVVPDPQEFHANLLAWGTTYRPDLVPPDEDL